LAGDRDQPGMAVARRPVTSLGARRHRVPVSTWNGSPNERMLIAAVDLGPPPSATGANPATSGIHRAFKG
jgi:hypothetical protein